MVAIPTWLTGRRVTAYVITGQTIGVDGTLTDATGAGVQPLAGLWEEIDFTGSPQHEEISAADSPRQHNVILQEGQRLRMSVIMEYGPHAGAGTNDEPNPLAAIAMAYDIFKVVFSRGGMTWTCYFTRGDYDEAIRKGKCLQTLSGVPCDAGAGTLTYAAAA